MRNAMYIICLLFLSAPSPAQEPVATKPDYKAKLTTVGGEIRTGPDNSIELNQRVISHYETIQMEHEKGVFLAPVYNFGDTDVVLFWVAGSDIHSTGVVRVITVKRDGTAKVSDLLGTGMLPVVTRKANALTIFFPKASAELHGGSPVPESWIWQNGTIKQVRATRR